MPKPSAIDSLRAGHPALGHRLWARFTVDPTMLDDTFARANISLLRRVLHRLDLLARDAGEPRAVFIARTAIEGRAPAAPA